jgi:hypothetical protein
LGAGGAANGLRKHVGGPQGQWGFRNRRYGWTPSHKTPSKIGLHTSGPSAPQDHPRLRTIRASSCTTAPGVSRPQDASPHVNCNCMIRSATNNTAELAQINIAYCAAVSWVLRQLRGQYACWVLRVLGIALSSRIAQALAAAWRDAGWGGAAAWRARACRMLGGLGRTGGTQGRSLARYRYVACSASFPSAGALRSASRLFCFVDCSDLIFWLPGVRTEWGSAKPE